MSGIALGNKERRLRLWLVGQPKGELLRRIFLGCDTLCLSGCVEQVRRGVPTLPTTSTNHHKKIRDTRRSLGIYSISCVTQHINQLISRRTWVPHVPNQGRRVCLILPRVRYFRTKRCTAAHCANPQRPPLITRTVQSHKMPSRPREIDR